MDARHQYGAAVSASALLDVVAAGNHELRWLGVRRDVLPGRDVVLEHASAAALNVVRCDHGGQRDAEGGARRELCCLCRRRGGLIRDRAGRRDRRRCGGRDRHQAVCLAQRRGGRTGTRDSPGPMVGICAPGRRQIRIVIARRQFRRSPTPSALTKTLPRGVSS